MPRTLLIDGDILVYQVASRHQHHYEWDEGLVTPIADGDLARRAMDNELAALKERLSADRIKIALKCYDAPNWRLGVYPEYKSNRNTLPALRPLLLVPLRDYLLDVYKAEMEPTLEADDLLGIWATSKRIKGERVIVSEDKDLQQIPGLLYNPRVDKEPIRIKEEVADRFHLMQTLTGDQVDGYPGCPGVGRKRAAYALDLECSWETVVAQYKKWADLTEEDALVQARVARILRAEEWDHKDKKVRLWKPTPRT